MQTRDECPVTTAYQLPLYPYNVHSSYLFQQGKDRHEPLRRKTFSDDRRLQSRSIERKQQTDIWTKSEGGLQ